MNDTDQAGSPVAGRLEATVRPLVESEAYRCIAPVCRPLGCSMCNCAIPADVYAALGKAFQAAENERIARLFDIPPSIHGEAEDWSRDAAARIRAA